MRPFSPVNEEECQSFVALLNVNAPSERIFIDLAIGEDIRRDSRGTGLPP